MKFLIKRGPNCDEASVKTTIVMEKAILVTVIIEVAMVDNNVLSVSWSNVDNCEYHVEFDAYIVASADAKNSAIDTERNTISSGVNQKLVLMASTNLMIRLGSFTQVPLLLILDRSDLIIGKV